MLTHLDLFSGIGGFALACQWAGIETIGFVEIDKYCQKVLQKHWPNVPIVEDIRDVERIKEITADTTRGRLQQCECQGESSHDSSQVGEVGRWRGHNGSDPAILVTAGFPCQPFSVAGKRGSKEDDRYLWPETLAIIEAIKPKWVLLENVTGIINLALDTVLSDLEGEGYATETLVIPACAVNAWHRRDRVWIVGYATGIGLGTGSDHKRGRYILDLAIGETQKDKPSGNGRELWVSERSPSEGLIADPKQPTGWRGGLTGQSDGQGRERAATEPTSLQSQDGEAHPDNLESGSTVMAFAKGRESWEQTEPEGWEDSGRGSQEIAIADPSGNGSETGVSRQDKGDEGNSGKLINGGSHNVADTQPERHKTWVRSRTISECSGDWWAVEPELGRVANELSTGLDGDRLNDQMGNTQAITEELHIVWEALREMWVNQEFTKTPSQLRNQPIPSIMCDLPYKGRPTLWHSPKETNQELYDLWDRVCTSPFQEAQHLLPRLLEGIRQAQRYEAVASMFDREPSITRVSKGVDHRVDRLKCLGNAIVPRVAYEIIRAIVEIDKLIPQ